MEGFEAHTYGDTFADVYDDWYGNISDVAATVATVADLTGAGRVLELGIGTGRLALPLAAKGVQVEGIDASQAMLNKMLTKPGGGDIPVTLADMTTLPVEGPFTGIFVAFNTFFNLATDQAQRACMQRVGQLLEPNGWFAVEAFVPSEEPDYAETHMDATNMTTDRVVLTITKRDPTDQTITGHHIEITEAGGIRLRPTVLRYLRPEQLDTLAAEAGLLLDQRWSSWNRDPFDPNGNHHISLYRLQP